MLATGSIFAPWIAVHESNFIDLQNIKKPPTVSHILGTDHAGRDVFSRLLFGSRVTLDIAAVALLIGAAIGTLVGLVSGHIGGWVDNLG